MIKAPCFSILVPVYNTSSYLSMCLASVDAQTYRDFELVLVDDGSTDNSGKMCDEFAAAHTYTRVIHQENKGLLIARRVALNAAKGGYIVTLDSDDALRRDTLALLAAEIDAHEPDIITFDFSRSISFTTFGPSRLSMKPGFYESQQYDLFKMEIAGGRHNNLWSKCYKRSIADVKADYSGLQGLTHAEDLLQILPIVDAGKTFAYLGEALYYYRPNPSSATGSYRPRQLNDLSAALNALLQYSASWGDAFLDVARKGALLQISYLLHMLVASKPGEKILYEQIDRIGAYADKANLFGPWISDLRFDKRIEMQAFNRGQQRRVVRMVKLFEIIKHIRDARSK